MSTRVSVIRKVLAGRQNKLSSDGLFHSIIDAMETVPDSFDERLIIGNRLDQNGHTSHSEGVKYSTDSVQR